MKVKKMEDIEIEPTMSETEIEPSQMHIPQEWSDAVNTIADYNSSSPPVSVICGAKNTGKSTFSRHLLNTLLIRYKRVAYLDTDVGQPEFTPPGCLSLSIIDQATSDLAIPCLKTPERCYFYGDVSSKRDPEGYLNCVIALHDHYRQKQSVSRKNDISVALPLIVNTPGWVKGIGLHILENMLKLITPTHVVKINVPADDNTLKQKRMSAEHTNLGAGMFWLGDGDDSDLGVTLLEICSACKDQDGRPLEKRASHIREGRLVSYFRQCFPRDASITTIKELANALASHVPYQVSIPHINIRHLHCEVPSTEALYSLNATIVGLALSPGDTQSLPVCVGLGIIRGIDASKNLLYVITPVPQSILARVDVLLQGLIQIPTSWLQVKGCVSPYMSTNVLPDKPKENSLQKRKKTKKNLLEKGKI